MNARPRLEIHISEIALREYRGKMIDELLAAIDRTRTKMTALQAEWQKNDIAKQLDYPFPRDRDIFPKKDEIISAADRFIGKLLDTGVKQVNMQEHHRDAVWENYFNWDRPFNVPSISERADKNVRRINDVLISQMPGFWKLQSMQRILVTKCYVFVGMTTSLLLWKPMTIACLKRRRTF